MKLYIKGYYGYKNFGDELLLVGLINFWSARLNPEYIYIESGDKTFLQTWIQNNHHYISFDVNKIQIVTKSQYILQYYKFWNCYKIIGGGECISPVANFPDGGRKYIIRFFLDILRSRYAICGGVGTPNDSSKLLYKILITRADSVVVRDPESQNISLIYNPKAELYHDFALDVIDLYIHNRDNLTSQSSHKYILLNLKKSEYNTDNLQLIKSFCDKYPHHDIIYIANFIGEDDGFIDILSQDLDLDIQYYDWTTHNIEDTLALFDNAQAGWGVRLHFLMILKTLGKHYEYIYYQEKIAKLIG